ncbi:MAG TPA: hypothetical protein VMC07_02810 [Candidatus Omnitrophota bacterium]|nr:hypothetical protein [Candidatus Omnitrophota bacterium]
MKIKDIGDSVLKSVNRIYSSTPAIIGPAISSFFSAINDSPGPYWTAAVGFGIGKPITDVIVDIIEKKDRTLKANIETVLVSSAVGLSEGAIGTSIGYGLGYLAKTAIQLLSPK